MNRLVRKIRSSLTIQVVLLVTLAVVAISSFYSYHHYIEVKTDLFQNTEMQLLRIVEGLKKPVEIFIRAKEYDSLDELIEDTSKGADIELIAVFDPKARVIASNKRKWLGMDLYANRAKEGGRNRVAW